MQFQDLRSPFRGCWPGPRKSLLLMIPLEKVQGFPRVPRGPSSCFPAATKTQPLCYSGQKQIQSRFSKRYLHTYVHSSAMHKSLGQPKRLSTDEWERKDNTMEYYLAPKKEILPPATRRSPECSAKQNKLVAEGQMLDGSTHMMDPKWSKDGNRKQRAAFQGGSRWGTGLHA